MSKGAMVWWEDDEGVLQSSWISKSRIFSGRSYESEALHIVPEKYESVVVREGEDYSPDTLRALLKAKGNRA